jgi:hypothetical protein
MAQPVTDMYEFLDALAAAVAAAEPSKREALAQAIDAYCKDFPSDFFWAIGPRAPTFLSRLLQTIDSACHPKISHKANCKVEEDISAQPDAAFTLIFGH